MLRKPFSSPFDHNMVVKDLLYSNKEWNIQKNRCTFDDPRDVEDIKRAFISKSFKEDRGIWIYSKDGNLTTKSAYNFLINEDLNQNGSDAN